VKVEVIDENDELKHWGGVDYVQVLPQQSTVWIVGAGSREPFKVEGVKNVVIKGLGN
jgi:hypothetical protein